MLLITVRPSELIWEMWVYTRTCSCIEKANAAKTYEHSKERRADGETGLGPMFTNSLTRGLHQHLCPFPAKFAFPHPSTSSP